MGRVKVDDAEVARLARGEGDYGGVTADLQRRMGNVLAAAQAAAPVVSGAYRDGLHLVTEVTPLGVSVAVAGDSSHDYQVEANYGVLARALDAAAEGP
ncbi:MAG: hypothetical protein F2667_04415 [Actinobacteria bacterium]|nr:hypothetical protein [Actinomycetota bacterium]